MSEPTDSERRAALRFKRELAQQTFERYQFRGRGRSYETIEAIVACGIYEPERLLFMTARQIAEIPGIGKTSMSEIVKYRQKFLR
jgi:hypothetical protein